MSVTRDELIELLAAQEHDRWSRWEKYREEAIQAHDHTDVDEAPLDRWRRQRETPYVDLSEKEKESDRKLEGVNALALAAKTLDADERDTAWSDVNYLRALSKRILSSPEFHAGDAERLGRTADRIREYLGDPRPELLTEIDHLRKQRDALQKRGTELVMDNQRRRRDQLIKEELHREIGRKIDRVVLLERVAMKMWDGWDAAASVLSEDECYVLEAIEEAK